MFVHDVIAAITTEPLRTSFAASSPTAPASRSLCSRVSEKFVPNPSSSSWSRVLFCGMRTQESMR